MGVRKAIEDLIVAVSVDNGIELSGRELYLAVNKVHDWFDGEVYEMIDTAIADVIAEREPAEPFAVVKFYMNGDEDGKLYLKELEDADHYQRWMSGMDGHIEVFSTNFK